MSQLPLGALRAFEASARHLNFTRAAEELCVTQGAVSHQVRALEARLGVRLFQRLARGLALTDEGEILHPTLTQSFIRMGELLDQLQSGMARRPLTVGVVNTFLVGWLLPRIGRFEARHPLVDLRLRSHNNKVDLAADGLDCAIQFGDGAWAGSTAHRLVAADLAPLCAPDLARTLRHPSDLAGATLLRSFRPDEWPRWFTAANHQPPPIRGPMFDSSLAMAAAAERSQGVALAPPSMFAHELAVGRLVQPFAVTVDVGGYFLTHSRTRPMTPASQAFLSWCLEECL